MKQPIPNAKQSSPIDQHKVKQMLDTLRWEFKTLSAKKPNDPVNEFKLKCINDVLAGCNEILQAGRPYEHFTQFEPETLPTNSDVALMIDLYFTLMPK